MLELKSCTEQDIAPFKRDMIRSGLVFGRSTELFKAIDNGVIIGFCGIVWRKTHAKFKDDYVLPEFRRRGYFKGMISIRIQMVKANGLQTIKATCTPLALPYWLSSGAVITKEYSKYTSVRLDL